MRRSGTQRRSSSADRGAGQSYGSAMRRSSSVDRLSGYGRPSVTGRPSVAPLRVRNEVNVKVKNSHPPYDGRNSFGWKSSSSGTNKGSWKTPQKNRASMYSRLSGVGVSSHKGIPKDPRKLHDKGFQQKCITNVFEFLVENGYSHQISTKVLASPTTKDFLKIFEFLYGQFEPKFKLGKKPEEEVPVLLKSLKYPFLISKSSIFAVGTSHTWPYVLSALDWMVNLIKFQKTVTVDDFLFLNNDADFDEIPESRIKFDYFEKTYEAFLEGHDTYEEYDAKLADMLKQKYYGIHGSAECMEEEGKRYEIEFENLIKDVERLKVQQVKLAAVVSDEQSYVQYIDKLMSLEKNLHVQYNSVQEELMTFSLEHDEVCSKIRQMQQIYDTQDLKPADIDRLNLERQELKRKKDSGEKQSSEFDEEIWNYEKEMAKVIEKVENKCREYNKKARKLKLIPDTAENACGIDYELSYTSSSYESNKFQNVLKPALNELKKKCGEIIRQKEIEKIEHMNFFEQVEELNDELKSEIDMMETKLKRTDEEYDVKKQACHRDYQKAQENIDYLQKTILEYKTAEQQSVAELERDLWETAKSARQKLEQKIRDRKQYDKFLETVTQSIVDHRMAISSHIETMHQEGLTELEKVKKEMEEVKKL